MTKPLFKKFDVVQILSVKDVKFVSGPKNKPAKPHGNWSVVGFVDANLMLARDSTIALVPIDAVRKVAAYDLEGFLEAHGGLKGIECEKGKEGKTRESDQVIEGSSTEPK